MGSIYSWCEKSRMETNEILDTSIALDCMEGIITIFTLIEHPPCGDKFFEILFPETKDYVIAVEIARKLRKKGTPVGAIDMLIAAMAVNRSLAVRTSDGDFKHIQAVMPELTLK